MLRSKAEEVQRVLTLRRDEEGKPLLHTSGQAVRVEDQAGNASWVPVADLPEALPASERAEVAAAVAAAGAPPAAADQRPPVIADSDIPALAAAGVPVAVRGASTGQGPAESRVTGQSGNGGPGNQRTGAAADPVILDAQRRQAQARARAEEAKAEEAESKRELMRKRVYEDRARGGDGSGRQGPAVSGNLGYRSEEADRGLQEARLRRQIAEEEAAAALAEAEAVQARIASGHLDRQVRRKVEGTRGLQLFWLGALGYFVGTVAGNVAGAGVGFTMLLGIAGAWFLVWGRLRRVAAEARLLEARTEREEARRVYEQRRREAGCRGPEAEG